MNEYFYYPGADGMRFCYAKEPTFECPHGRRLYDVIDLGTGDVVSEAVQAQSEAVGVTFRWHATAAVRQAAEILGCDAVKLAQILQRAHRYGTKRMRVDGKLSDRCDHCGHRMERHGFRCWIERPANEEEAREAGSQISAALGFQPTRTVKSLYLDTKREAKSWAYEEARISKAAAN